MARTHYEVNEVTSKPARNLMDMMRAIRSAIEKLKNIRNGLVQQKDAASDYTTIATDYAYSPSNGQTAIVNAGASFAEIDTAYTTAYAALAQMCDRHLTE
jgi:hypothetical protein